MSFYHVYLAGLLGLLLIPLAASASCSGLEGDDLKNCKIAEGEMLRQAQQDFQDEKIWRERALCSALRARNKTAYAECLTKELSEADRLKFGKWLEIHRSSKGDKQ